MKELKKLQRELKEAQQPMPINPCYNCGFSIWYWPGDYYVGRKQWLCEICLPSPKEVNNELGSIAKQ